MSLGLRSWLKRKEGTPVGGKAPLSVPGPSLCPCSCLTTRDLSLSLSICKMGIMMASLAEGLGESRVMTGGEKQSALCINLV